MLVIFNTKPLLFQKTGIGYYIDNLYRGLLLSEEVDVQPTIDMVSAQSLRLMSKISSFCRKAVGDSLLRLTVPVGDFLISWRQKKNIIAEADIYHEANYDVIPEGRWKTVATIHDLAFLKYPKHLPEKVLTNCRSNLDNILMSDRFITCTGAVKMELIDFLKISEDRIDVIPLAPSGGYRPVDKDFGKGRDCVNRYTRDDYILCVGTIEPRKNIPVLLKAFKILKQKFRLKLLLAGGKGWFYDDIMKMPYRLGIQDDVIFTGYVDEDTVLYLYNYASAVVNPSIYEGFGLPVVEAMSCGVPAVISDIPSLREVAGDAAIVFNPTDYEELAYALGKVLSSESLRTELKKKGLQRSREYSWDKTVSLTIQTYKKALER